MIRKASKRLTVEVDLAERCLGSRIWNRPRIYVPVRLDLAPLTYKAREALMREGQACDRPPHHPASGNGGEEAGALWISPRYGCSRNLTSL